MFGLIPRTNGYWKTDSLFGDALDELLPLAENFLSPHSTFVPKLDIEEQSDNYTVTVELAGVKKEDVEISAENGLLTIRGEKKSQKTTKHRSERMFGSFSRRVSIPKQMDTDNISASYADGILTLTIPKTKETKQKRIEIK